MYSCNFWLGLEPREIGPESRGDCLGAEPKLRGRVAVHAILIFGMFCQKASHPGCQFVCKAKPEVFIDPPDRGNRLPHEVCIVRIEEAAGGSVVALPYLHRAFNAIGSLLQGLGADLLEVDAMAEGPP
jgi:hypothetical protein